MQFYIIRFNKVWGKKQVYNFTLDTFFFKYISNILFYPLRSEKRLCNFTLQIYNPQSQNICV